MALMTVDKDPNGDFRSKERWSANRKLDVVLRLLRGEKLEELSREVGIESWAHVAKVGNRFAALQPVYDAVIDRFGTLEPDIARGIMLRHDWGSQYRAHHFQGSLTWLGIADDAAFVGEPRALASPNGSSARAGAVPVGPALRRPRRTAPSGRRFHRDL